MEKKVIRELISRIRPQNLFYDFDGVMTNNTVMVDQNGKESVVVNRSDGLAISRLKGKGYNQVIVSTESNPVVSRRAEKLNLPIIQGVEDKGDIIGEYCKKNNIDLNTTLYIGNDVNDIPAFRVVNIKVCPADAYEAIKEYADIILNTNGGDGVIRELMDYLIDE